MIAMTLVKGPQKEGRHVRLAINAHTFHLIIAIHAKRMFSHARSRRPIRDPIGARLARSQSGHLRTRELHREFSTRSGPILIVLGIQMSLPPLLPLPRDDWWARYSRMEEDGWPVICLGGDIEGRSFTPSELLTRLEDDNELKDCERLCLVVLGDMSNQESLGYLFPSMFRTFAEFFNIFIRHFPRLLALRIDGLGSFHSSLLYRRWDASVDFLAELPESPSADAGDFVPPLQSFCARMSCFTNDDMKRLGPCFPYLRHIDFVCCAGFDQHVFEAHIGQFHMHARRSLSLIWIPCRSLH